MTHLIIVRLIISRNSLTPLRKMSPLTSAIPIPMTNDHTREVITGVMAGICIVKYGETVFASDPRLTEVLAVDSICGNSHAPVKYEVKPANKVAQ